MLTFYTLAKSWKNYISPFQCFLHIDVWKSRLTMDNSHNQMFAEQTKAKSRRKDLHRRGHQRYVKLLSNCGEIMEFWKSVPRKSRLNGCPLIRPKGAQRCSSYFKTHNLFCNSTTDDQEVSFLVVSFRVLAHVCNPQSTPAICQWIWFRPGSCPLGASSNSMGQFPRAPFGGENRPFNV